MQNINPKLRIDGRYDLENAIKLALRDIKCPYQSCLVCLNFNEEYEICKKYNAKPPARVIAYACSEFEDINEIPF